MRSRGRSAWNVNRGALSLRTAVAQAVYTTPLEWLSVEAENGVIVNDKVMGMREIVGNERVVSKPTEHLR